MVDKITKLIPGDELTAKHNPKMKAIVEKEALSDKLGLAYSLIFYVDGKYSSKLNKHKTFFLLTDILNNFNLRK